MNSKNEPCKNTHLEKGYQGAKLKRNYAKSLHSTEPSDLLSSRPPDGGGGSSQKGTGNKVGAAAPLSPQGSPRASAAGVPPWTDSGHTASRAPPGLRRHPGRWWLVLTCSQGSGGHRGKGHQKLRNSFSHPQTEFPTYFRYCDRASGFLKYSAQERQTHNGCSCCPNQQEINFLLKCKSCFIGDNIVQGHKWNDSFCLENK